MYGCCAACCVSCVRLLHLFPLFSLRQMGWPIKGTDCLTSSSTRLQTPDWSCTMSCEYTTPHVIDGAVKWTQHEHYYRISAPLSVPHCRYLIRPDPLSLVPNQGSSRKCSAGISESHRFDTQDSTHLWETTTTTTKRQIYRQNTASEKRHNNRLRNGEVERDAARWHTALVSSPHSVRLNWESCMELFYSDGNVLFMHLSIFKAESCGHRSALNE